MGRHQRGDLPQGPLLIEEMRRLVALALDDHLQLLALLDLPDGSLAEANYLWFSRWYLDTLNAMFTAPLAPIRTRERCAKGE